MIPNPTGNPLGMLDFGGIWGLPGIPGSGRGGGSFSSKIHLFLLLFFGFCLFFLDFFPFGNDPGMFWWEGGDSRVLEFRRSPGRTLGHAADIPEEQEEEKGWKKGEKRRKRDFSFGKGIMAQKKPGLGRDPSDPTQDPFPEGKVGKPLPDSRLRVRCGGFSSFFPAPPPPQDPGHFLLPIPPKKSSGKAPPAPLFPEFLEEFLGFPVDSLPLSL